MKKVLSIIGIVILFLIATIIFVPLAFKGTISELVLKKANESVDATITYGGYKLSLLSSFPDFTAKFNDVSIVGKSDFEGDTLFALKRLVARIDIMSLLKNEGLLLKELELNNGALKLIENDWGMSNWDIGKPDSIISLTTEDESVQGDDQKMFKLLLNNVAITDFNFIYINQKDNYRFSADGLFGQFLGVFEGVKAQLAVELHAPSISFVYDSISYLKKGEINLVTQLDADLDKSVFTFISGGSMINNMPVTIDGGFSMLGDSVIFNTKFDVPEIGMEQLLKQVPVIYKSYFKDVEVAGNVSLKGEVDGIYYGEISPKLKVGFEVHDGSIKYPELSDKLVIDELVAQIAKPEGELDLLTVGIPQLKMQLAGNPLSMHARFSKLLSDPYLDVALDGTIDLGTLSKVIPLGDSKIKGLLTADATIKGTYSALENNDFSSFISTGSVDLKNFSLVNSNVPQGIEIQNASLVLKNQDIQVKGLSGKMGKSDFSVNGNLSGLLTYLFDDEQLIGQFNLSSNLLDLNEFLKAYHPTEEVENEAYVHVDTSHVATGPIEFPQKMKLGFNTEIAHLLLDKMDINHFAGHLQLDAQQLTLMGLSMNMIGGQLKMSGAVLADGREQPGLNFNLDATGFDLPTAYKQITMVQKYMPFAAKSQGDFSTKLNIKSTVNADLKMIMSSVSANGIFSTHDVKLMDNSYFANLKSVIQYKKFKNLNLDDFSAAYSIANKNLNVESFKTGFANQPVSMGGTYNLGGVLDFRVDATIDKELLSNDIQNMIAYIPGHQKVKNVDVGLNITGDAKKPTVTVDNDKIKKQVIGQLKNSSPEELQDAAIKLLQGLFK